MKLYTLIALITVPLLGRIAYGEPAPTSFTYILQADSFAKTKATAVKQLTTCGRDWLVLDAYFDSETAWNRKDMDTIRAGMKGRKVLAYLSIGEAEDYRPYWRKEWHHNGKVTEAAPAWLRKENPEWEGNYQVKYWHKEWQKLIISAVDNAMARGFDGVYLDIVDGFETYEQDGQKYLDNRINPETRQSYRRDMVDWVKQIATRARTKNPDALVIPQNGSQLLAHTDFLSAVSGIGIEDLFTNGKKLQSRSHTREVLQHLKKMTSVKKPVLVIEYPKRVARQTLVKNLATKNGMTWLVTDRQLKTLGVSGR